MTHFRVSLFAMTLAAAGVPIYIHLPRFATAELGLSLTTIGAILIGIRVFDFAQDPLLGRMVDKWPGKTGAFSLAALFLMAAGFVLLFSIEPIFGPAVWLTCALVLVFTGYSLGTILLYGESVTIAGSGSTDAQFGLAAYREAGVLGGVILAAAAPALLVAVDPSRGGYRAFGLMILVLIVWTAFSTRKLWIGKSVPNQPLTLKALKSSGAIWLVMLALVNSLPLAITSTLFLFFVEDRLELPSMAGGFLILFFLAAGLSVPLWSALARRFGSKPVLIFAMVLAIVSFLVSFKLPAEAAIGFAVICFFSGAAVGADMVILPALFSATLNRAGLPTGQSFGIWSFAGKLSLAIAAVAVLPMLDQFGFVPGQANSVEALKALNFSYAIIPCCLKVLAIILVSGLPRRLFET